MDRLRIGLIGCGGIARSAHLPSMAVLQDRLQLVATADISAEAAEAAARPWGAQAFTDYRAVLDRPDIAAVIIATPEARHAEQTIAAAAAGKHVLCEKPIAPSLAEADAMIEACRSAGVRLMIGHSRRFTSRYLEIDAQVKRGTLGKVRLVRENERRAKDFGGSRGLSFTPRHWSGDPKVNRGVALLAGIHEVDILRWFIGEEPVCVTAEQGVQTEGNVGVPDFISLMVRFTDGSIGSSEISRVPPDGYPAYHQLELYGTRGAIRAKDHDSISLVRYRDTGADFPGHGQILLRSGPTYVREQAEFLAAIIEQRPPCVAPADARASLAMALAAIRSAETGRTVRLDEVRP